jgi:hypothetical protein
LGAGYDGDARLSVEPMTILQLGAFLEYFSLADFYDFRGSIRAAWNWDYFQIGDKRPEPSRER